MSQRETPAADAVVPTPSELQDAARRIRCLVAWDGCVCGPCKAARLLDRAASALTEQAQTIARLEKDAARLDAMEKIGLSISQYDVGWSYRVNRGPDSPWSDVHQTARESIDRALAESEGGAG